MRPRGIIIAIDGVVGAGKTATAKRVAEHLDYRHIDTGAMYRAVTLAATRGDVDPGDLPALQTLLAKLTIDLQPHEQAGRVLLNEEDVSEEIRRPEINRKVGSYANIPQVRRTLVAEQQRMGLAGGIVAEGRDMATVVFPDAELKIHMFAELAERVDRRHREMMEKGVSISKDQLRADIEARDTEDAERDYGVTNVDAQVTKIDTTAMTLEGQVEHIVELARKNGA
ncbi:MAG: (d)CMP kinase [Gemmatimonadetes bacterium]|jgi:cytidylate kinase|nr:(d)CMP kinase [Gemmatimonadota bacterium]MBT5326472.1 (d)CMP kinase [Gemmatimonadota bacterium]MBT5801385.1 (d)CMP kinase [Gemmatimonadota bacterium]MBT6623624.1 (d)CMP kinase [Gemmatimonadota bacterium]MBT6905772.1 (d)CMP kinase [Gemmatimonadota bacterium]